MLTCSMTRRLLPRMLERLKEDGLDLVIGSRYAEGGSVAGWNKKRRLISRVAGRAARLVMKANLKDPMSGFFIMRRDTFDAAVRNLSQLGFKILLDLFASAPRPLRFAELPYHFRRREHGESKLDSMAAWEYGMLLADKLFGHIIPPRFLLFGVVGGLGLIVHMLSPGPSLPRRLSACDLPGHCGRHRDDVQFWAEQSCNLSRPVAYRLAVPAGAALFLCNLLLRRGC